MPLSTLVPFALVAVIGIVVLYAAYRAGALSPERPLSQWVLDAQGSCRLRCKDFKHQSKHADADDEPDQYYPGFGLRLSQRTLSCECRV